MRAGFLEDAYSLPDTDGDLAAECVVTTFRAGGKGGQHVNKTDSAVRLRHVPSGVTVTCQRERSQYLNRKFCLQRLRQRLAEMLEVPEVRIPTRVPAAVKRKRLDNKKNRGRKKAGRKPVAFDD